MAEWSGGARTQRRSQMAEVEIEEIRQLIPDHPDAPGAIGSPQIPGMTPDKCTVPGHAVKVVPKPTLGKRRPMSQAGTAQELIAVYTPSGPNGAWVENDFNGAHTSFEELSKVNPALTQPHRPAPGYETSRALAWLEQRSAALEAGM